MIQDMKQRIITTYASINFETIQNMCKWINITVILY